MIVVILFRNADIIILKQFLVDQLSDWEVQLLNKSSISDDVFFQCASQDLRISNVGFCECRKEL